MAHTNCHSGTKLYDFNGNVVEAMPYFLYEVTIYKHWSNGFAQLGSKFFRTKKYLRIKKPLTIKYCDGYFIEKGVTLLSVTPEFIRDNNISEYIYSTKRKVCKKPRG